MSGDKPNPFARMNAAEKQIEESKLDESKGGDLPEGALTHTGGAAALNTQPEKTAEELGVDQPEKSPVEEVIAEIGAAGTMVEESDGETIYTSHPIQRLTVGRFEFLDGTLKLRGKDVAEFDEFIEKLPLTERSNIAKLDTGRINDIVSARVGATTGITDSASVKEALEKLRRTNPTLGTVAIDANQPAAFTSAPQTDQNREVPLPVKQD